MNATSTAAVTVPVRHELVNRLYEEAQTRSKPDRAHLASRLAAGEPVTLPGWRLIPFLNAHSINPDRSYLIAGDGAITTAP